MMISLTVPAIQQGANLVKRYIGGSWNGSLVFVQRDTRTGGVALQKNKRVLG